MEGEEKKKRAIKFNREFFMFLININKTEMFEDNLHLCVDMMKDCSGCTEPNNSYIEHQEKDNFSLSTKLNKEREIEILYIYME